MKQKTKKTIELVYFLHHIINKKNLLKSNQSMVLAVSGGQDSITLFFIFLQLKEQWNWKYKILYCNHLWQKDSFYTLLHLFKLSYLLNIPIYLTFTLQKIFTEQFARNWRSLTFQRITEFYFFNTLITGHSKSDRVETGLFNLFRGSSTKGVSSLNWTKVVLKEGESFFKINKKTLNLFYIKNCAPIVYVDISCLITYCNIIKDNQKCRQFSNLLKNNRICSFFFFFFKKKKSLYTFFVPTTKCSTHKRNVPSTPKKYLLSISKRDVPSISKRYVPSIPKRYYLLPLKETTPIPLYPEKILPSTRYPIPIPLWGMEYGVKRYWVVSFRGTLYYPSTHENRLPLYPFTPKGYRILGTGYWVPNTGYGVPGTGYWGTYLLGVLGYVSFRGTGYLSFRGTYLFGVLQSGIVSLFLRKKGYDTLSYNSKHTFFRKNRKGTQYMRTKRKRAVSFNLRRNIKKRLKKKEQLPNQKTILKSEKIKTFFFLKAGKCLLSPANRKFYLVALQPILKSKTSCFNIFNRKKTNNLFGSKQYCLQLKQLVQYYLQLVLWKKKIQTIHNTKQNVNHILDLLLTNLVVKWFTLGFSRPFKKSEDFVIKKFYIYKVDCIKCQLLGVGTKKNFEKKTSFLKETKNCLCFFKGNAVFFCFSPLQKPLQQPLR